jgi:regulatory protein
LAQGPDQLDAVLTQLQSEGFLSDSRFAESVARVRGARFGAARVRYELQQKGVSDAALDTVLRQLNETESDRVRQVWEKKFGTAPTSAEEAARQQRFLMQRGFSSAAIGRLMRDLRGR